MSLKLITSAILDSTSKKALCCDRLRMNHNFHELSDSLQRMLNAIEPDSYIQPHRHLKPPKVELFLILRGKACAVLFDAAGNIEESKILTPDNCPGVEFAAGQWHTIVSLESGTVLFEVKDGPYIITTDKDFATFAPPPDDTEAATEYLKQLREELKIS